MTIFSSITGEKAWHLLNSGAKKSPSINARKIRQLARCLQLPVKSFMHLKFENQVVIIIYTNSAEGVGTVHLIPLHSQSHDCASDILCIKYKTCQSNNAIILKSKVNSASNRTFMGYQCNKTGWLVLTSVFTVKFTTIEITHRAVKKLHCCQQRGRKQRNQYGGQKDNRI